MAVKASGRRSPANTDIDTRPGRQRLILVAMRLFAELGFDAVTVRHIAAEAGVSVGLTNHHFVSKQGLREAVDAYFVERTSGAFDRALDVLQSMDPDRVEAYQRAWITRYADEWPPFAAYLRRAIADNSAWGTALIDRYYGSIRRMIDGFDRRGLIGDDADRVWLPLLYLFLLTGPLMLDPYLRKVLGASAYEPEMWGRMQRSITELFWHGASPRPGGAARSVRTNTKRAARPVADR